MQKLKKLGAMFPYIHASGLHNAYLSTRDNYIIIIIIVIITLLLLILLAFAY
jgi:hypothetical protein